MILRKPIWIGIGVLFTTLITGNAKGASLLVISRNAGETTNITMQRHATSRSKRSVMQLGHMMRCNSGCEPLLYKRYGCYCGFKGSGQPVDAIDSCCRNHDWCYSRIGCPPIVLYFLRYAWMCLRPGQALCGINSYVRRPLLNRCATQLCECDRTFSLCISQYRCPHHKAICWSNPLIALTNLLFRDF